MKSNPLLKAHRETVASTRNLSPAVMLGSSFAVAMGLFAWAGHAYDEKHGTAPLGVLVGIAMAFGYGAYEVWKVTRNVTPHHGSGGGGGPRAPGEATEKPQTSAQTSSGGK